MSKQKQQNLEDQTLSYLTKYKQEKIRSGSPSPATERELTELITNSSAQCVAGWKLRGTVDYLALYIKYVLNHQPGLESTPSMTS